MAKKGHRGLFKRNGSNVWWMCYADHTGKVWKKSTFCTNFKEAEQKLRDIKSAIGKGEAVPERKKILNYTFNDLADKYTAWIKGQASAEYKTYIIERLKEREVLSNNQTAKLGALPLRSFDTYLIEQLQKDLKRKGLRLKAVKKNDKETEKTTDEIPGLKDSSVNRILNTVKHMFSKATKWKMVEDTVLKEVREVKLDKEVGRLRYLSVKEAENLVNVCEPYLKAIVITALATGMRKSEILNLKWEDNVDLVHGFILLDVTKNKERRELPINRTLRETLNTIPRHFVEVEKDGQKVKELAPYVFCDSATLKPYRGVKRSFAAALKRAGIRDFHFHDLRHTYASQAMMSGQIDIATLSKLLGHKSLKMTMKYAHLAPAHLTKAANVMDDVFKNLTGTKLVQLNEKGSVNEDQPLDSMERVAGFGPVTPTLARLCSTN